MCASVRTPCVACVSTRARQPVCGLHVFHAWQASDAAIEALNNQFLCGRQISVTYAYKKDTKGEAGMSVRCWLSVVSIGLFVVSALWCVVLCCFWCLFGLWW